LQKLTHQDILDISLTRADQSRSSSITGLDSNSSCV